MTNEQIIDAMRANYKAGAASVKAIQALAGRLSQAQVLAVYEAATAALLELDADIAGFAELQDEQAGDTRIIGAVGHLRTLRTQLQAAARGLNSRCGGHLDSQAHDAATRSNIASGMIGSVVQSYRG